MIRDKFNELLDTLPELELNRAIGGLSVFIRNISLRRICRIKGLLSPNCTRNLKGL